MSKDLISNKPLAPRAEVEEKILRALRDAVQKVFDETGVKLDEARFTWRRVSRDRGPGLSSVRDEIAKINIRTTVSTKGYEV